MTTSFENLTSYKLNIFTSSINLDINPKEILDIDTSNFLEGTQLFNITKEDKDLIWKGYIPIKTKDIIKILNQNQHLYLQIDNIIIPNILSTKENFKNEKKQDINFFYKNKFIIILFIIILLILFFYKKYLK